MALPPILSQYQVTPILEARRKGQTSVITSLDLGRSSVEATITANGVLLPDGQKLGWAALEKIKGDENKCFAVTGSTIQPIIVHSPTTNWVRTLYPTKSAPTTLVAGFLMHRIKDIDPLQDTRRKIAAIAPLIGAVLDTATGLGYTAIEAARTASHVTTIELDSGALEIARLNPWSQPLFDNPKITQIIGDTVEIIQQFADGQFNRILHDPPTFSLGGELYSAAFYTQLYRVLGRGGRLFHYIGDLHSSYGNRTVKGVVRRLQDAGFSRITRKDEAFGVVALK